jgi:RNA polymerase sigma-54 factor
VQLRQDNTQRHVQAQKIAPHLIQANALLQCSNIELMQIIEQEQRENPALDEAEEGIESETGDAIALRLAGEHEASRHDAQANDGIDLSHVDYDRKDSSAGPAESDFDPIMLARSQTTLGDQLLQHLRATSTGPAEAQVAEYLVNSLDERGYLQIDLDEACAVLHVPCSLITDAIQRLQACDPPGIGARDLRECLLLQVRHLQEEGESQDVVAEALIQNHWEALIQRRHSHLARRLGVSPTRIETALKFIQDRLTPHPASQFRQPWDHRPDAQSTTVRPDVVIKRGVAGFEVEVLGFENMSLHINPHYRNLYESIRATRAQGAGAHRVNGQVLSPDHQKHVIAYVERANLFLKNLQQRRRTIQKIALALIESQQGFLETGQRRFLRPLTRTKLAETVGMHESTISRALLHKYVQLPSQEVIPFDVFFEQAVGVKEAVSQMIAGEDSTAPLSDQAITEALLKRGTQVARRTVVKYREELRIPASYLRRRR